MTTVLVMVAVSVVTGAVATWLLARQDARARARLHARLDYVVADRARWQRRALHAEARVTERPAVDEWPLYQASSGRPWIEPNEVVADRLRSGHGTG